MKITIQHQERYSRGELLLRTFFGWLYIGIPHFFLLFFIQLWGMILTFISFLIILFTGKFPKSFFDYLLGMLKWSNRVTARLFNLADGYPAFGIKGTDSVTDIEIAYPETVSRGHTLLRFFFGWIYVMLPHGFILYFRMIAVMFLVFVCWFIVLFTGTYPASLHNFNAGFIRWSTRINLYLFNMTEQYPPFTGDDK
jgi:hypothetical protein